MKRYIRSNTSNNISEIWNRMSGASQTAVEYAVNYHDSGESWEDAIHYGVNHANEGNYEPEYEEEEFYGDEANIDDVANYIELRYGVDVNI